MDILYKTFVEIAKKGDEDHLLRKVQETIKAYSNNKSHKNQLAMETYFFMLIIRYRTEKKSVSEVIEEMDNVLNIDKFFMAGLN